MIARPVVALGWTISIGSIASLVIATTPAAASAQARELASPRRESDIPARDRTALPPAPAPGMVPVVFEADEARALVVTDRLRRGDARLCVAPCAAWLRPGRHTIGVGDDVRPRFTSGRLRLAAPTTLELHYVDNALTRGIGFVTLSASLVTLGAAAYDFLDQGSTDPPAAASIVAGLTLGVSFALFFVSDGIDFRVHPGIESLERTSSGPSGRIP